MQQCHQIDTSCTPSACFYCYWSDETHVCSIFQIKRKHYIISIPVITSPIVRVMKRISALFTSDVQNHVKSTPTEFKHCHKVLPVSGPVIVETELDRSFKEYWVNNMLGLAALHPRHPFLFDVICLYCRPFLATLPCPLLWQRWHVV